MNNLPQNFEQFADARKQGFLTMKNLKDAGNKVVGYFCSYTPVEIFLAAGAVPVGICSFTDETIPEAEQALPRNLCPLIKSSYGFAVTQKCPYMYFSDLVVGETTCDGKKKMYELLGKIKNMHVMQLPQEQAGGESREFWYGEVLRLRERVEKDFGVIIKEEDIKRAIHEKNEERKLLTEFYQLSKLCPPPMTGMENLKVLYGVGFKFDYQTRMEEIRNIIRQIREEYAGGVRKVPESAKRILVTGCPLSGATEKVVRAIEESGGVVVAFENCTGIKPLEGLVDENAEPYRALADRYLNIGCSVMSPDTNRFELLNRLTDEFRVDGVVEMTLQACHTYALETAEVRQAMRQKNLPYIHVETDYGTADIEQIKTRIGAFIEMIS